MNDHALQTAFNAEQLAGDNLRVMAALGYMADDHDGQVFAEIEQIKRITKLPARTIRQSLRALEKLAFIERVDSGSTSQEYRVRTGGVPVACRQQTRLVVNG